MFHNFQVKKYRLSTRAITFSAVIGALYVITTLAIAPISYGIFQFRVSSVLYPLCLFDPIFALGLAVGNFLSNLASPFGFYDFGLMPIVALIAGLLGWRLRKIPLIATIIQSLIISLGVAIFPLGLGARLPFILAFPSVLVSQGIIIVISWFVIWKWSKPTIERIINHE